MLTTGIVEYIMQQAPVTAIVGANKPLPIPDLPALVAVPHITYQVVSDRPTDYTLQGPAGVSEARLLFECLAPINAGGYVIARTLALALKKAFNSLVQAALPDGTWVYFTKIANISDGVQSDAFLSRTAVNVVFTYRDPDEQ